MDKETKIKEYYDGAVDRVKAISLFFALSIGGFIMTMTSSDKSFDYNIFFVVLSCSVIFFFIIVLIEIIIYNIRVKMLSENKNFFKKSNMVLLITGSLVWLLIVYSIWADYSGSYFKTKMVLFGFIPIILANGWFFFKYFKNQDKDKIE